MTETEAREQYGDARSPSAPPWLAVARAVMQNETVGWVKTIHETHYGELPSASSWSARTSPT